MDDLKFDDLLRDKLKNFHDAKFDHEALDNLHQRFDSARPFSNSSGYRNISIAVASLFLLTGINFYLLMKSGAPDLIRKESPFSNINAFEHSAVDSLKNEIERLQCELTETNNSNANNLAHIKEKSFTPVFRLLAVKNDSNKEEPVYRQLVIGATANIPRGVIEELTAEGILYEKDGVAILKLAHDFKDKNPNPLLSMALPSATSKNIEYRLVQSPVISQKTERKKTELQVGTFSPEARNILEKHYMRGVGIKIGPHVDLIQSVFSPGSGQLTPRFGLSADWILSPHLSIESGVDYGSVKARLGSNEIHLTGPDPIYGTLESIESTSYLLSTPFSVKFRQWIFDKSQVVARIGYTPYWMTRRQIQSNYLYHDSSDPTSTDDHVTTLEKHDEFKFYGNTLTAAAGLNIHRKKNSGMWEVSLFYERKVGTGWDDSGLQLLGLRTGYWFKVR